MLRSVIAQAVEFHLEPDFLRQQGYARDYWIALRLCRDDPVKPSYRKKRPGLILQTRTLDGLKQNVIETIMSSQFDLLLAMALRANQEAKIHEPHDQIGRMAYNYKNLLLNVLILMFRERHVITNGEFDSLAGQPQLVVRKIVENDLVFDLRFFVGYVLFLYEEGKVVRYDTKKPDWIGFHLPTIQTIEPVGKILRSATEL